MANSIEIYRMRIGYFDQISKFSYKSTKSKSSKSKVLKTSKNNFKIYLLFALLLILENDISQFDTRTRELQRTSSCDQCQKLSLIKNELNTHIKMKN